MASHLMIKESAFSAFRDETTRFLRGASVSFAASLQSLWHACGKFLAGEHPGEDIHYSVFAGMELAPEDAQKLGISAD